MWSPASPEKGDHEKGKKLKEHESAASWASFPHLGCIFFFVKQEFVDLLNTCGLSWLAISSPFSPESNF